MADKQLNRTVEQINPLLDKIDELPDYMRYKGEVNDPSELPQEPTEGDTYLVNYNSASSTNISDSLYCRLGNSWKIIATKSYTKAVIDVKLENLSDELATILGMGAEILGTAEAHQDLNNYTTPGTYFCRNSTNAGYVDNKPVGGSGFRLQVENISATNTIRHTFVKPTEANKIYVRHYATSTWSSWYVFEGTAVT